MQSVAGVSDLPFQVRGNVLTFYQRGRWPMTYNISGSIRSVWLLRANCDGFLGLVSLLHQQVCTNRQHTCEPNDKREDRVLLSLSFNETVNSMVYNDQLYRKERNIAGGKQNINRENSKLKSRICDKKGYQTRKRKAVISTLNYVYCRRMDDTWAGKFVS